MTLDKNLTVWQRIDKTLQEGGLEDRTERENLVRIIHPYVVAEREDAR